MIERRVLYTSLSGEAYLATALVEHLGSIRNPKTAGRGAQHFIDGSPA